MTPRIKGWALIVLGAFIIEALLWGMTPPMLAAFLNGVLVFWGALLLIVWGADLLAKDKP